MCRHNIVTMVTCVEQTWNRRHDIIRNRSFSPGKQQQWWNLLHIAPLKSHVNNLCVCNTCSIYSVHLETADSGPRGCCMSNCFFSPEKNENKTKANLICPIVFASKWGDGSPTTAPTSNVETDKATWKMNNPLVQEKKTLRTLREG